MYVVLVPILFLGVATAQSAWEYNVYGITTDGQPCISNCKNNKCIADWNGKTKDCWTNNHPTAKFRTSNVEDKQNQYCLSNCGFFGYPYQWCVTTNQKGWDNCNAEKEAVSIYKKPCTSNCSKLSADYYWCFVDGTNDWQFCAPPREGLSEDPDYDLIDIRTLDDKKNPVIIF